MPGIRSLQLPMVETHWNTFDCDVPDPTDVLTFLAQFARKFRFAELYLSMPRIEVWHPQAPGFPPELAGHGGMTYPPTLLVRLVGTYDVQSVLAHELGHVAQRHWRILPDGDPDGRLIWQAWCGMDGPDDEETFASFFGACLLGQKVSPFMGTFPLAIAAMKRTTGFNSACQEWQDSILWWFQDPAGMASGWHEITPDGRHMFYDGTKWSEQP